MYISMFNLKHAKVFLYSHCIIQRSRNVWSTKYGIFPLSRTLCLNYRVFCVYSYSNYILGSRKCLKVNSYFLLLTLRHGTFVPSATFNYFSQLKRTFSKKCNEFNEEDSDGESDKSEEMLFIDAAEDAIYQKWSQEFISASDRHSVFVIQPYIKWGAKKKRNTTPELQLSEAVALVDSLHGWKVVDKLLIGLRSLERKTLFGSGNFERLKQKVRKDERITAVFISTKSLWGTQHRELQDAFGVPVYDRYTIIINLFRQHAVSREAKLQVAMAELPYLWSHLKDIVPGTSDKRGGSSQSQGVGGGGGETIIEIHKQVLAHRQSKIKQALEKLRNHRELLRLKRKKLEYPVVAVVGYTNSGKTSLIKALTSDENIQPKNQLFATLDVSVHMGILPSRMKVLYVDTIGFISDIPTNLLQSFEATLEDALLADVILHVKDISHPDKFHHAENVNSTLLSLQLSSDVLNNIIDVANKVDLIQSDISQDESTGICVSSTMHTGLAFLKSKIEETILRVTGRTALIIRVPMGGKETSWLYKESTVMHTEADPVNSQFLLMHVIITEVQLRKFHHQFIQAESPAK